MTRKFVSHFHKGIGDTVVLILATPQEIAEQQGSGPGGAYTGPRVTVRIVGVGETSTRWGGVDQAGGNGGLQPSPGLYTHYRENIVGAPGARTMNYINALVRLRGGEAAIEQLRNDITRVTGRSDIEVTNLVDQQRVAQHHVAFESRCLVAFAAAAFVAALFLVGQAIVRYAAASTEELRTLRALGMTPRQAIATAAAGPAMVGLAGAGLGVAGAVFASRWLPFGTAGLVEPSPGVSVDWVVLGPGLAVVVLLVAAGAAGAAWLALGAARRGGAIRRSTVATAVARRGLPVPIVVGTRFALEAGRGRTAVPVRPALVGAIMGVFGILAAFTFSHGVSDAASHPERFGQTYQLGAFAGINDAGLQSDRQAAERAAPQRRRHRSRRCPHRGRHRTRGRRVDLAVGLLPGAEGDPGGHHVRAAARVRRRGRARAANPRRDAHACRRARRAHREQGPGDVHRDGHGTGPGRPAQRLRRRRLGDPARLRRALQGIQVPPRARDAASRAHARTTPARSSRRSWPRPIRPSRASSSAHPIS